MDLVVLAIDLGLDSSEANLHSTEQDEVVWILERLATQIDLVEHLVPLVDFVAENFVDQVFLLVDVPEGLVVAPGAHILVRLLEDLFELHVALLDVELITHLHQEALVSLLTTIVHDLD